MTGPRFYTEWSDLAAVARDLLARRVADYPAVVAAEKMTQVQADEGIRVMALVVSQWLWVTGECDEPSIAYPDTLAMRLTLAEAEPRARSRASKAADKHGPDSVHATHARDYADCVAALAWHQEPISPDFATPRIVFFHRFNERRRIMREARFGLEFAA